MQRLPKQFKRILLIFTKHYLCILFVIFIGSYFRVSTSIEKMYKQDYCHATILLIIKDLTNQEKPKIITNAIKLYFEEFEKHYNKGNYEKANIQAGNKTLTYLLKYNASPSAK